MTSSRILADLHQVTQTDATIKLFTELVDWNPDLHEGSPDQEVFIHYVFNIGTSTYVCEIDEQFIFPRILISTHELTRDKLIHWFNEQNIEYTEID